MKSGPLLLLLPALPLGEPLLLLLSGMTTAGLTVGASPASCLAALLGRLTATAEAAAGQQWVFERLGESVGGHSASLHPGHRIDTRNCWLPSVHVLAPSKPCVV
jgi:hypothetical protein